jgi:hypothetical protein
LVTAAVLGGVQLSVGGVEELTGPMSSRNAAAPMLSVTRIPGAISLHGYEAMLRRIRSPMRAAVARSP